MKIAGQTATKIRRILEPIKAEKKLDERLYEEAMLTVKKDMMKDPIPGF